MSDPFPGVCLVTGGSSGLGRAVALAFARAGARVAISGRNAERLESARQEIEKASAPGMVLALNADIADPVQSREAVRQTVDRFGRVDLLVNNAALAPLATLEDIAEDVFQTLVDTNIHGVFQATRAVWPAMKGQGGGVIVNISSVAARDPFPGLGLYGATKAWLETLTLALAREGESHRIRVYGVRPGAIDTPLLQGLFPDFPRDQLLAPRDVAEVVRLVCQPALQYSSGQVIEVTRQPR